MSQNNESQLNKAIRDFEIVEANLLKAEKLYDQIASVIPDEVIFIEDIDYENNCRSFEVLIKALPKIDGWKPEICTLDLNVIAQNRLEARELGIPEFIIKVERSISEPYRLLSEYRYRFNQKRRELIRDSIFNLIDEIDLNLRNLKKLLEDGSIAHVDNVIEDSEFESFIDNIAKVNMLLGSTVSRSSSWGDLFRHMRFRMLHDLKDIIEHDWPSVKKDLNGLVYNEKEPIPVEIEDIGTLVNAKPSGSIATKLNWENLTDEDFERLIFILISSESNYENPEWLMKTNAPDRGRDLSVNRVYQDSLAGISRQRVIIQCKHWQAKSISIVDIASIKVQMSLWEPPRVDVLVIATSGRFTSDAVAMIEKHNQSNEALKIEMWAESNLERLLASRPHIIAEFKLR